MIQMLALFIATTLYKYLTEEREKKKVKGAFSMYLSPDVISQVLDDPSALKLGGEKKELTVFNNFRKSVPRKTVRAHE
jgi:adenylate cyclase